jgi:hypothetical protein
MESIAAMLHAHNHLLSRFLFAGFGVARKMKKK